MEDNERERGRERFERFERGVYITRLTGRDFEQLIGVTWRSARPKKLDLSADHYKLESLEGLDLLEGRLTQLTYVDLTDNRLHNIDYLNNGNGFENLVTLIARRNLISDVRLQLRRLMELNLAHNMLENPPDLRGMEHLEVLILSHNRLSGSFQAFKDPMRLKQLDLAHNQYQCTPSELSRALDHLKELNNLLTLRMYGNPFVACFKEYQVFVVKKLPSLTKLDDVAITRGLRQDVMDSKLYTLDVYDDAYRKRLKEFEKKEFGVHDRDSSLISGFPRLKDIMDKLEEILDDPGVLQRNVAVIRGDAERFWTAFHKRPNDYKYVSNVEDAFWSEAAAGDDKEGLGSHMVELILGIMERHESVRYPMIHTLGCLTSVYKNGLGAKCMHALGRTMLGDKLARSDAFDVMKLVVKVNMIVAVGKEVIGTPSSQALVSGLNEMLSNPHIREEVAQGMTDLLQLLMDWFLRAQIQEGPHIVKLLALLTDEDSNATQVASKEIAVRCVTSIENKSIAEAQSLRKLYNDLLNLSENVVKHGTEEVVDRFVLESTHVTAIARGKAILDGGRLHDPVEADTAGKIFDFVTALLKRKEQVLRESVESFHILEVLCKVLTQHNQDPAILRSCCTCLRTILEDPAMYRNHAAHVVEKLQMVSPLLDFLYGKRFRDLYKRAMKRSQEKADEEDEFELPPLTHLSNELIIEAFLAIIKLVAFFAQDGEEDDLPRQQVNDAMSKNNREQVLLRLLLAPNDELKLEVMQCIISTPVDQISPEEMGMIIKCISDTRNIGEGEAEKVLALLVTQLGRLVEDQDITGEQFKKTYAVIAIAEVFDTLCRNAVRHTGSGEEPSEEENQKVELSRAIVAFLRSCGCIPTLRKHLRNPQTSRWFPQILKYEEELHSANVEDVALEQTWVGRSLENLLSCLSGRHVLDPTKKVLVRVLSRMADVLEGHTDGNIDIHRQSRMFSLHEIAQREVRMWPMKPQLERNHCFLDDDEWADRAAQTSAFLRLGGMKIIRDLLSGGGAQETAGVLYKELQEAISKAGFAAEHLDLTLENTVVVPRVQPVGDIDEAMEPIASGQSGSPGREGISGRTALMSAIQCCEADSEYTSSYFTRRPATFEHNHDLFIDTKEKTIHNVYSVCAYLRILHALVVIPPFEECRVELVKDLRQVDNVVRLMAIVDQVPCLAGNCAAKFLRLMHYVVRSGVEVSVDIGGPLKPDLLRLMANFVRRYAEAAIFLLDMTKQRVLDAAEKILCIEMARFMATLLQGSPLLVPPTPALAQDPAAHAEAVSRCVEGLIDDVCIRVFIGLVLYDIQLDSGGGERGRIRQDFARQAYAKVGLKEYCSELLVRLLVRCPVKRYDALELFSAAEVFGKQTVRLSYLTELLRDVALGRYMLVTEHFLRQRSSHGLDMRILLFETVDVYDQQSNRFTMSILCATTKGLYLLAPPEDGAAANDPAKGPSVHWEPGWEEANPRYPKVMWERPYTDIARIFRCYGTQLLALQWKVAERSMTGKVLDAASLATTVIVFHRSGIREEYATQMRRLSGTSRQTRAKILNDPRTRGEVLKAADGAQVLATSVALLTNKADAVFGFGVGRRGAKVDTTPRLFVLTEKDAMYFKIDLASWSAPDDHADGHFDDVDEFMPEGMAPAGLLLGIGATGGTPKAADPEWDEGDMWRPDPVESQRHQSHHDRKAVCVDPMQLHRDGGDPGREAPTDDLLAPTRIVVSPRKPRLAGQSRSGRVCGGFGLKQANASSTENTEVLTLEANKMKMPPSTVEFSSTVQPELTLKRESNEIIIHFYDDSARELWRRGLAYVLSKSGNVWERGMG